MTNETKAAIPVNIDSEYNYAQGETERGNWRHRIILSGLMDEEPHVTVDTSYGGGTPSTVFNMKEVHLEDIPDGTADTQAYVDFLESTYAQDLMHCIAEGHTFNGYKGKLTEDAHQAMQMLEEQIRNIEAPSYWDVRDWLDITDAEEAVKTSVAGSEDIAGELSKLMDIICDNARDFGAYLSEKETLEYLKETYQDMLDEGRL